MALALTLCSPSTWTLDSPSIFFTSATHAFDPAASGVRRTTASCAPASSCAAPADKPSAVASKAPLVPQPSISEREREGRAELVARESEDKVRELNGSLSPCPPGDSGSGGGDLGGKASMEVPRPLSPLPRPARLSYELDRTARTSSGVGARLFAAQIADMVSSSFGSRNPPRSTLARPKSDRRAARSSSSGSGPSEPSKGRSLPLGERFAIDILLWLGWGFEGAARTHSGSAQVNVPATPRRLR
mmetsp:Transcript_10237/g.23658  ORF Transcript_10237/g.23658 Transcript_10237/m.23658 type:complete len:245 (-) Transcript_10237:152-886(-)